MTYNEFIQDIIDKRGQYGISEDEYFEAHHIVPVCMGGEGVSKVGRKKSKHPNIIWLYAREHFIAHKLLAIENPNNRKLVLAWSRMAFPKSKRHQRGEEIPPEDYELLRKMQAEVLKGNQYGKGNIPWNKGKKNIFSQETLKKMSELRKGRKLSEETKRRMSEAIRNRPKGWAKSGLKGKKAITNGVMNRYILPSEPLPDGYRYGLTEDKSHIDYDKIYTPEKREELSMRYSGENNPNYGNHKMAGGNNSHAIYIYTFEGIDYQCRDDLMVALKERWPKITECTIRRIQRGQYKERTIKRFGYIIDNLSWRLKKSED